MKKLRECVLLFIWPTMTIFLVSCATTGGDAIKRTAQLRNLGITTQGEHARIEVVDVIQPGDPSSWVEDARWTEVVLRISNTSNTYLFGREAHLVDVNGAAIPPAQNPLMLADLGQQVSKSMGTYFNTMSVTMLATEAIYTVPFISQTAWLGMVPYVGFITQGLSAVETAYSLQQAGTMMSAANRPMEIMAELRRRSFPPGAGVGPGGHIQGSIFFPYTFSPQKILLTYDAGGTQKRVEAALAQAVAELNAKVESVVLKTNEGEVPLTQATEPVALGTGMNLTSVRVNFSRGLTPFELRYLRVGFSPEGFPCAKADSSEVGSDQKVVTLSKYPDGCLKDARGFYDFVVAGLNVEPVAFAIQKGFPAGTKRPEVVPLQK